METIPDKPTKNQGELPEAAAVAFFAYKRLDGFEVSLTLRGNSGSNVLVLIEKAITQIKQEGGIPLSKGNGFTKPVAPTKPCPTHPSLLLTEKTSKTDPTSKYWSHSRGVYPNLDLCYGKGFKSEIAAQNFEVGSGDF